MENFWAAINNNNVIETPVPAAVANRVKLSLPLGTTWGLTPDREIYVRECYNTTAQSLINTTNKIAVLEGSSNIGKSVFIYYFIYAVIRHHVVNAPVNTPRPTFVIKTEDGTFYHLHSNNGVPTVVEYATIHVPPVVDYFISDTNSQINFKSNKLHLHVTSSSNIDYSSNVEALVIKKRGMWLLFEPFTFTEYLHCCGTLLNNAWANREELQYRYDLFGGAIGLLRQVDEVLGPVDTQLLDIVWREILNFYEDVFTTADTSVLDEYKAMLMRCAEVFSSNLLLLQRKVRKNMSSAIIESNLRSLFTHVYRGVNARSFTTVPSSKFAEYLLCTLMEEKIADMWENIKSLLGPSGAGIAFEKLGHEELIRLLRNTDDFQCELVTKTKDKDVQKTFSVPKIPQLRKVCVRTWADLLNLQPNEYAFPVVSNFKLIDSAIKILDGPAITFQFTRSFKHTSDLDQGQYEELSNILDENDRVLYVHVVPEQVYKTFQGDKNLPEGWFTQYKYQSEEHVATVSGKRTAEEMS